MADRMLEIVVPPTRREALERLLDEVAIIDGWDSGPSSPGQDTASRRCFHVLVTRAQMAELMDRLEPMTEGDDPLRVVVTGIDATLPRAAEADDEPDRDGENGKGQESAGLSRVELHEKLSREARLSPEYLWMVVLSSIVASAGLLQGNTAVVVGAMVIAPLLAPNMALALAATLADLRLGLTSVRTGMTGVAIAVAFGYLAGRVLIVDPALPEIASRTRIGQLDVVLALAAGAAGALAVTSGVAGALVGVMVAVALLPPLLVAALLAGGGHWQPAGGALLLYSTNIAAVNLAGIAVFLARGITPRRWWEKRRAQRAAWLGMAFWVLTIGLLLAVVLIYNRG